MDMLKEIEEVDKSGRLVNKEKERSFRIKIAVHLCLLSGQLVQKMRRNIRKGLLKDESLGELTSRFGPKFIDKSFLELFSLLIDD